MSDRRDLRRRRVSARPPSHDRGPVDTWCARTTSWSWDSVRAARNGGNARLRIVPPPPRCLNIRRSWKRRCRRSSPNPNPYLLGPIFGSVWWYDVFFLLSVHVQTVVTVLPVHIGDSIEELFGEIATPK